MKTLKCIIADDEPIARQILESYISEMPYLELTASCKNAFEVLDVLQKESIDLLFLDINMPKLSGLSMLRTLQHRPEVIITTAYPEYAIEGFELSVTDYLLKPFSLERFLQAVMKVQQKEPLQIESHVIETQESAKSIFVKSDKKLLKIVTDDISYIEAYGNYVKIYTSEMILTPQTLSDIIEALPSQFLRIHKSFAINFNKLKLIDGNQIVLDTETTGLSWKDGHRIIEIGCVELLDRRVTGNHYHVYLNPEREVDAGAFAVHGLSTAFLQSKPRFIDEVDAFLAYIAGSELVIHNAPFDVGFLNHELKLCKAKGGSLENSCTVLDTLTMARSKHTGVRNSLDALCKRYYVDNSNRELHGALLDASLLAKVYLAMTGGQGTLFGQAGDDEVHVKQVSVVEAKARDIPVIAPQADVLQMHQDYLSNMQAQGACLWLEDA